MAYSLYIDRNENFECDVSVKNATLKNSKARLIVKSDDVNLLFEGSIRNGRCIVPISRMKGLLEENTKGTMELEIIVDDTHFVPWRDKFVVEEHTSVKVNVHEQKKTKPVMEVSVADEREMSAPPEYQLKFLFERFGISKKNVITKKDDLGAIIKNYFIMSPEFRQERKQLVKKAVSLLN